MIGHHLLAFDSALAAVAGFQQVNALADSLFSRQNNEYQIPEDLKIIGAYAGAAANVRARLITPSLSLRGNPQIVPISGTLLPAVDPNFMDFTDHPISIRKEENLRAEMESNSATAALVALIVADKEWTKNINRSGLHWIRGTVNVTTVANVWAGPGPLVLDESLEGGSYVVYGMQAFFATALAARLVFQNQYYRPGCLGQATAVSRSAPAFWGGLGVWGYFDTYSLPQLEVIDTAAAAVSYTVWLLVAKADGFQPPFRG